MQEMLNKLVQSLFNKNSVADCSINELTTLADQYPYFSTSQLLLTQKLKQENDPGYAEQHNKTSLFVNNPLWLNLLLNEQAAKAAIPQTAVPAEMQEGKIFEDFNNDELVVENFRRIIPEPQQKTEQIISIPAAAAVAEGKIKVEEPAFTFEPYHTVDYFASQGIKPVQEEKPVDRFGQQLKSFTEWLKTLRQLPQQEIIKLADSISEEKVVQLANHSIEDREVLTEAMAEVWIRQGQPEKAAEVYSKLSLLNPSKSSYFANLIETLKRN